jgi:hypothetical protein
MADVKISGLPASTTPLAGTEVLPIVQGGATKQVSIANVTAGRSVAALSVITPTIQAEAGSAGGTIKNGSGVAQMQWGSGGASNLSLEVATNINPANASVSIAPTGTGVVTINPATAGTINNMVIGGTTAAVGTFTDVISGAFELSSSGLITEATTSRTLSATDNGKIIYCTSGSATTITCAVGLGAGFSVTIIQGGAGKVTVAAGGQTLVSYSSLFSTMGQYAVISLVCPVANTFVAAGNLGV